jgi:hypothetical protein
MGHRQYGEDVPHPYQKAQELAWIKEVQRAGALPPGDISEDESPDALVRTPEGIVGIEVTEYIRGQSDPSDSRMRAGETAADRFGWMARQAYEAEYSVPLWVSYMWSGKLLPRTPKERSALASEFAELVAQHIPGLGEPGIRIPDEAFDDTELERYLGAARVRRVSAADAALWSPVQGGFVGSGPEEVQYLINEKEAKLPSYRAKADQVILLIVADGRYISSDPGDAHKLVDYSGSRGS